MGFARRVVRKSVRKATPRTVRRAMHPARTARHAVTPRPIKQLSRGMYTVTNPLGAAENALIGSALNAGGKRKGSSRRRSGGSSGRGTQPATTYAGGMTAGQVRAAEGAASNQQLAQLMAVQRSRFTPASRPLVPAATPVDPDPIFAAWWAQQKKDTRFWQRARRRQLQAELHAQADVRSAEMFTQAEATQAAEQQRADAWWAALLAGDPAVVTHALDAAFADNPAAVYIISATSDQLVCVVSLPDISVLPERKPHVTPGGRRSSKPWTKTELNDVYAELLGAHLLATARETWAVAPSVTQARIAGVIHSSGENNVMFDVTCQRQDVNWENDRYGTTFLSHAARGLQRVGRTREVQPWAPTSLPDALVALVKRSSES